MAETKALYELGETPPLGRVPRQMYASVIRQSEPPFQIRGSCPPRRLRHRPDGKAGCPASHVVADLLRRSARLAAVYSA